MEIKMLKNKASLSQSVFEDHNMSIMYLKYHNQLQQKHKTKVKKKLQYIQNTRELYSAVTTFYIIWEYRIFIAFEEERETVFIGK